MSYADGECEKVPGCWLGYDHEGLCQVDDDVIPDQAAACEQTGQEADAPPDPFRPLVPEPYRSLAPKPPPPYVPTRRDYFAAAALTGLLANPTAWVEASTAGDLAEEIALHADTTIAALDEVKS